jgi:RHS repeat-associated protein
VKHVDSGGLKYGESPRSPVVLWDCVLKGYASLQAPSNDPAEEIFWAANTSQSANPEDVDGDLACDARAELETCPQSAIELAQSGAASAPALAPLLKLGQAPPPLPGPAYRVIDLHVDHLGSTRVTTDENGAIVSVHDFLPFGEEIVPMVDASTKMFTGHERDQETGLDYMMARLYSSGMSRFLQPDPSMEIGSRLILPTRWNAYLYTLDNPVAYNDPDGRRENPVTRASGIDPTPRQGQIGSIRSKQSNPSIGQFGVTRTKAGKPQRHDGIDINAPKGTPVVAAEDGTVTFAGKKRGYGNTLDVKHDDGSSTRYAHLDQIKPGVQVGGRVSEGGTLGTAGTSGNAAGYQGDEQHLHFEVRDPSGALVDPVGWLNEFDAPEPASDSTMSSDATAQADATSVGSPASGCGVNMSCQSQP